jgi:hypothetical protein
MFVPAIAQGLSPARNAVPSTRTNGARVRIGTVAHDAAASDAAHKKLRRVIIANPRRATVADA